MAWWSVTHFVEHLLSVHRSLSLLSGSVQGKTVSKLYLVSGATDFYMNYEVGQIPKVGSRNPFSPLPHSKWGKCEDPFLARERLIRWHLQHCTGKFQPCTALLRVYKLAICIPSMHFFIQQIFECPITARNQVCSCHGAMVPPLWTRFSFEEACLVVLNAVRAAR